MKERVITFFTWENMNRMGERMTYLQKQNGDKKSQNKEKEEKEEENLK